jgi:hypothetical protein
MDGWIYTIHLDRPLGTSGRNAATHYTGWASPDGLLNRLLCHRQGNGSRMMACVAERGIAWHVGALRRGTRDDERRMKQHGAARWCLTCRHAQSRAAGSD